MKNNKIVSIIVLVVIVLGFFYIKDMFFSNVMNLNGKIAKTREYQFINDDDGSKIQFTYYNEFEKKDYTIRHYFSSPTISKKISKEKDIYVKYNKFYPGEPKIIGESIIAKLITSTFGMIICVLAFIVTFKEIFFE